MMEFIEHPFIKMAIRPHRGGLEEAMAAACDIPRTIYSLLRHINDGLALWGIIVTEDKLELGEVEYDSRIDWFTRLIKIEGYGVWGMLDYRPNLEQPEPNLITRSVGPVLQTTRLAPVTRDGVQIGWGRMLENDTTEMFLFEPVEVVSPTTFSIGTLRDNPPTPAAKWRESGEPDPFAGQYDCERHQLPMGNLTDDELANEVFLYDHRGGLSSMVYLTAAKERIRWLSRKLYEAEHK